MTRKQAEKAGWTFEHSAPEATVVLSETQGVTKTIPATFVASKYVNRPGRAATLVHEQGETEAQLLERIASYEAHLASLPQD